MKTKSLFFVALLTISAIGTAVGKDEPRKSSLAVVTAKGSEIFKVIYRSEVTGKVRLNLYNAQSNLIFTETLTSVDGFILPLNFSRLDAGEYTLELIDASGKRVEKVNYKTEVSKTFIHVSKVAAEKGKYVVSVANAGVEKINIRIYDAAHNLLHTEVKEVLGTFAQLYTIKNVAGVTFQVSDSVGNTQTIRF